MRALIACQSDVDRSAVVASAGGVWALVATRRATPSAGKIRTTSRAATTSRRGVAGNDVAEALSWSVANTGPLLVPTACGFADATGRASLFRWIGQTLVEILVVAVSHDHVDDRVGFRPSVEAGPGGLDGVGVLLVRGHHDQDRLDPRVRCRDVLRGLDQAVEPVVQRRCGHRRRVRPERIRSAQ